MSLIEDVLEIENFRRLHVDQQLHTRFINRNGVERSQHHRQHYQHECRDGRPAPLIEDAEVFEKVRFFRRGVVRVAIVVPVRLRLGTRVLSRLVVPDSLRHQKNLSRMMSVSPGSTASPSFALISFLLPSTSRTILMRPVDPRSVTPPASANACNTV